MAHSQKKQSDRRFVNPKTKKNLFGRNIHNAFKASGNFLKQMTDPRIIVAIDTFDLKKANAILDQLDPKLCKVKIGSVVFNALGKSLLHEVFQRGFKIFRFKIA